MMKETWMPVVGYEGDYSVSDAGRVRRESNGIRTWSGRILKSFQIGDRRAYAAVMLYGDGKSRTRKVHHLVLEAFVGPRPAGHECNHKSGNKADNRLANLEWVTRAQNMLHARSVLGVGILPIRWGEENYASKLTEKDVRQIRKLVARGVRNVPIANKYGVNSESIRRIRNGETWKGVGLLDQVAANAGKGAK